MRKLILFLASGFGSGYLPGMPGTYGSAIGIALVWGFSRLTTPVFLVTFLAFFLLGVWLSDQAEIFLGRKDPQIVVIDEIVGMIAAVAWIPFRWELLAAGFILFRVFDIWKPPPIRSLQSLPGGWGVMIDDLAAAVCTNVILQVVVRVLGL